MPVPSAKSRAKMAVRGRPADDEDDDGSVTVVGMFCGVYSGDQSAGNALVAQPQWTLVWGTVGLPRLA
jgi:hypothetical protein